MPEQNRIFELYGTEVEETQQTFAESTKCWLGSTHGTCWQEIKHIQPYPSKRLDEVWGDRGEDGWWSSYWLKLLGKHTEYIHTKWRQLCDRCRESTTHGQTQKEKQKKGCIMQLQKECSHSLCKQFSRAVFRASLRWYTHSLLPSYSLCDINLICPVAILQLNRCMYSRF